MLSLDGPEKLPDLGTFINSLQKSNAFGVCESAPGASPGLSATEFPFAAESLCPQMGCAHAL